MNEKERRCFVVVRGEAVKTRHVNADHFLTRKCLKEESALDNNREIIDLSMLLILYQG